MPHLFSHQHPNAPLAPLARVACALTVSLLLLGLAAPTDASTKKHNAHKTAASKASAGKGSAKASYRPSPSEETRAERERRLLRECRGMPDAGACKGFTRR